MTAPLIPSPIPQPAAAKYRADLYTNKLSGQSEAYGHQFAKLTEKKGIIAKIIHFFKLRITPPPEQLYSLKWSQHTTAEHTTDYVGNLSRVAFKNTIDILKKMPSKPLDLMKQLQFAALDQKEFSIKDPKKMTKEMIKQLKPGEAIVIRSNIVRNSAGHAMLMKITCNADGSYRAEQHNSGTGIRHHPKQCDELGREVFQRKIGREGISKANLMAFIDALVAYQYDDGSRAKAKETIDSAIDHFYEQLLPLLKGNKLPDSNNPRDWYRSQITGSCSASCILSLLRSELSEKDYNEFMDLARYDMLLKTYTHIKTAKGDTTLEKIACLEVLGKLERRFKADLPSELRVLKEKIQARLPKAPADLKNAENHMKSNSTLETTLHGMKIKLHKDKNGDISCKNPTDSFIVGFFKLQEANFDPKKVATVMPFLKQPNKESTLGDYLKMVHLASYIAKLEKKGGLTRDQIYTLTNLSALLNAKMEKCYLLLPAAQQKYIQDNKPPEIAEFQIALDNLHDKNNKLNFKLNNTPKDLNEDFTSVVP